MKVASVLLEETGYAVLGSNDMNKKEGMLPDHVEGLLAAANASIDRLMSRDSVAFLDGNRQERGE